MKDLESKLLEINIQNNFRWTSHVHAIFIKIACNIGNLLYIKNCIDTVNILYNSLSLSNI